MPIFSFWSKKIMKFFPTFSIFTVVRWRGSFRRCEADTVFLTILLLVEGYIELRERRGFFVHFQAVPFPKVRFFLSFFDDISKLLSLRQQRCCRESLSWRLGFCQKHLWMRQFHFSYFQIDSHTLSLLCRGRDSVPDNSRGFFSNTKTPTRKREGVTYEWDFNSCEI